MRWRNNCLCKIVYESREVQACACVCACDRRLNGAQYKQIANYKLANAGEKREREREAMQRERRKINRSDQHRRAENFISLYLILL